MRWKVVTAMLLLALNNITYAQIADESGKGYWVSRMNTAGYSRHDVLREFTRSAEFSKICSSYGVTVGEI